VAVEDLSLLQSHAGPQGDKGDVMALLQRAIRTPPCRIRDNGLSIVEIAEVTRADPILPDVGLFFIRVDAKVDSLDALWNHVQSGFEACAGYALDRPMSTEQQVDHLVFRANGGSFRSMGLKAWSYEVEDEQEDVRFVWSFPDGESHSLPAYVDPQSGFISILGRVPTNVSREAQARIVTDASYFEVAPHGLVEVAKPESGRAIWHDSWSLMDAELPLFLEDRRQAIESHSDTGERGLVVGF
jgi:hypothetical protein